MAPVKKVLVFTMEGNADGEAALAFFQARGVAVDVRDVGRDPQASLDLFAREVMPEFHARQAAQDEWKQNVLAGQIVLEDLDTERYDLYAHQNEDIVRMTPEQLKQRMAEKERLAAAG